MTLWQVASAGPSSRIYTLAFASGKDRSLFFWYDAYAALLLSFQSPDPTCSVLAVYTSLCLCRMQEPKLDDDTQLTEQVNQVLTASIGMLVETIRLQTCWIL